MTVAGGVAVALGSEGGAMINDWDLTQVNLGRLQEQARAGIRAEVAVLPTAALEAHNRHLPEGQDFLHTTWISRAMCARAHEQGARVIWLPTIAYGVDCNLLDFPLTVHVSQSTLDAMLGDILSSLEHHGVRKILIVNGHGGNDFTPFVREFQSTRDVHVFVCNWWTVGADRYDEIFENPEDHAGELETSVALELYPDLVELDRAGQGATPPFRFEALEKGWVKTSRRFARLNDHCAVGDPGKASTKKGKAYIDIVVERMARFVCELSGSELDESFPMMPGGERGAKGGPA